MNLTRLPKCAAATLAAVILSVGSTATPAHAADAITTGQWYANTLHLSDANKISKGEGIKVALIDTGVDATHPDIAGSVEAGTDLTGAGSGDGLTDPDGHGTSMASLIVGHGRIHGVAPKATVVAIRASLGLTGSATKTGEAVRWAISQKINVISISQGFAEDDLVLRQAIAAAVAADVVVVAAAGNRPTATRVMYPAAYAGVIAVSGTDAQSQLSSASVIGPQVVLAAPSDHLSVAHKNHTRVSTTGTSNAAALVAGTVALLRSQHPDAKAQDIIQMLTSTATDKGAAGRDDQFGYGVVNPVAALHARPPVAESPSATAPTAAKTSTAQASSPSSSGLPIGAIALIVAALLTLAALAAFLILRASRAGR
ncbi:type VII secretion-associated serine protease mycosin [Hamadaea flava]|uniref:S8 family serine peptidase n=1 Tax=Hamadaea flava TaxID=1742688 RepID=A0ABV8LE71_9ACTN|nr:S8 family serine peptidase [Hamadaea flava]MCP2323382.1 type VII secretion-associated serine protease mycosin [Hamadaea flava]